MIAHKQFCNEKWNIPYPNLLCKPCLTILRMAREKHLSKAIFIESYHKLQWMHLLVASSVTLVNPSISTVDNHECLAI